ncbi:MAG: hypothetical protein ABI876_06735, partial [Bacteroidota bacterium]
LREKGLHDQSRRMAEKAIAIAREHEAHIPLIDAIRCMNQCVPTETLTAREIDERFDAMDNVVDEFRNLLHYERISSLANSIQHNGHARTKDKFQLLERCRWDPMMDTMENARSIRAQLLHLAVIAHYDYEHGNYEILPTIVARQVELLESHPAMIRERPHFYLATLGNRALTFKVLGDIESYRDALAYFRKRGEELLATSQLANRRIRYYLFTTFHISLLDFHTTRGTFEEGAELLAGLEEGLREHATQLAEGMAVRLLSSATKIQFGRGEFRSALDFSNRLLAMPEPKGAIDIYHQAKLFSIFIHFELGNTDLVASLIRSVARYYGTRGLLERFERCILRFFERMLRTGEGQDQHKLLLSFREELLELQDEPGSRAAFYYFNYIAWTTSRIEHRRFDEVVREMVEIDEMLFQTAA